jgi:hypothetical protein
MVTVIPRAYPRLTLLLPSAGHVAVAPSLFALGPEFLASLCVQTPGIGLIGASVGDRSLVARTHLDVDAA